MTPSRISIQLMVLDTPIFPLIRSLLIGGYSAGVHPIPFRTRKLSPAARMVLPGYPGGRVRRRRSLLANAPCVPWIGVVAANGGPTPERRRATSLVEHQEPDFLLHVLARPS